jgi:aminobenzoyl-glutamate utilization protein B
VESLSRRGVATDMGNVSWVAPSIHPFIATAPRGTAWHSTESARASATPQAYEGTLKAAKAFALTAIDIFSDPALVRNIKEEFQRAQSGRKSLSPA